MSAQRKEAPQARYPQVEANPNFVEIEQAVLAKWQQEKTFEASVENRPAKRPDGKTNEYIFYDGPPFANGLPHYGHLLTGFVKDVFARYHTMQGQRVERRFGWDCHGLPAEMGAEKELGISGRAKIMDFGIEKFNEFCRTSVMKYAHEWEHYITREGRWVDFKNDYKTMYLPYMESVIWAFSELYKKGLVYEAYRVMPYSWAAETPVSNFETKLDNVYREREDKAITVAFELVSPPAKLAEYFDASRYGSEAAGYMQMLRLSENVKTYKILAWTTTPWTLPSNLALAVNAQMDYVGITCRDTCFIVAKRGTEGDPAKTIVLDIQKYWKQTFNEDVALDEIERHYPAGLVGRDLKDLQYKPLFPYFESHPKAFRILDGSSFITESDGTGIVHMAPGFGEDDQKTCEDNEIKTIVPVDGQGRYTNDIFDLPDLKLKGLNVIAETKGQTADEPYKEEQVKKYGLVNLRIIQWLKQHGHLIKQEEIKHNYPHCWRTDTPLIYRAMPSWYVEVTKFRDRAVELNKQINWIPDHVRDGQMGHMLATAPDWSISRNRFWGTPIPVWRSDNPQNKELYVFGSIKELEDFFGTKVTDLHRPYVDQLTRPDPKDPQYTIRRVEDVFDCWFESGSMPFAQVHYPFENKEWFETHFPADFITEYVGQTRGWFNTLIMLATALFDKPPFKNCICHGVVLDAETGLKYSKRLKNFKDPLEVINEYGADALRWLMLSSPVMRGQDLMVDPDGKFIRDVVRLAIKPIWNAYNFFCLYANADGITGQFRPSSQTHIIDRYILAKCHEAVKDVQMALDAYDTPTACNAVSSFFEVLNNWYIRRSRDRFWSERGVDDADKQAAYDTLYTVLVTMCRAGATLLPFTLEAIYQGLTRERSVHLANFPRINDFLPEPALVADMDRVRDICSTALALRNDRNIRVRQPLQSITIVTKDVETAARWKREYGNEIAGIIKDEVNVKSVLEGDKGLEDAATFKLQINSAVLGKRLPEKMKQILPASKKGEWKLLGDGNIEIFGEKLLMNEYSLFLEPKPELKDSARPISSNDALVILDLKLSKELEQEGIARDIIRMVQQARKDADLKISDRIALVLEAGPDIAAAIAANKDEIARQVLASQLTTSGSAQSTHRVEQMLDDEKILIGISVAN